MEPAQIFELIIKADDVLKYATEEKRQARTKQARDFLRRARDEAAAIDNVALVEQAERRLADLEDIEGGAD